MNWIDKSRKKHGDKYDYTHTEYKNANTKVEIICPIHGSFWQTPSAHYNGGSGCPSCAGRPQIDTETFINKLRFIHGDNLLYDKVEYVNNKTPVIVTCPVHGDLHKTPISLINKKRGCEYCTDHFHQKKSTDDFIKELTIIHGTRYDYSNVDYTGALKPITIVCKHHGKFSQIAKDHLRGGNCPKCVGGISKPWNYYYKRFLEVHGNEYEYDKTTFVNSRVPMSIKCRKHGWFLQSPAAHYGGQGCPRCGRSDSSPEIELVEFLESYDINVTRNNRTLIAPYEIDILINDKPIGIEYCGLYWHGEQQGKNKDYHRNKYDRMKSIDYDLITIFEDEWLNNRSIVESVLLNRLGLSQRGKGARKLQIREISRSLGHPFVLKHHLIGNCNGKVWIGAYDNDQLVGVMVFGKPTRQTSSYEWELIRFVTDGKSYSGLPSRMFTHFVKNYKPSSIVSFVDCRWYNGGMYKALGFVYDGDVKPDYAYTKRGMRFHKSSKRKSRLIKEYIDIPPTNLTEREMAIELGYDRIWDCGKLRYVWTSIDN